MNAQRLNLLRIWMLATFALTATLIVSDSIDAAKPKRAEKAANEPAEESAPGKNPAFADYRSWKPLNKEPIRVPSVRSALCEPATRLDPNGPHADGFINVYVNPVGRDEYLAAKAPKFSVGTVIVKEKLTAKDDKQPHDLGVMIKREAGFAPDAGDWQYAFVDREGNVTDTQTKMNCAKCHQIQTENDHVFRRLATRDETEGEDNKDSVNRKK